MTVKGGIAEVYADPGKVEICMIDYDNDPDERIPPEYADLPDYFCTTPSQEGEDPGEIL